MPTRTTRRAALGCLLALVPLAAVADTPERDDAPRYVPGETRVAVLPVANLSGEKWELARDKQSLRAGKEMRLALAERGFALLDGEAVSDAVKETDVDLLDEEQHNRATLYKVGRAAKADLVLFAVITDVRQEPLNPGGPLEGKARLKVWLLDVRDERAILSAKAFEGGSRDGLIRGSERIIRAVGFAARNALKEFLKPYPLVEKK